MADVHSLGTGHEVGDVWRAGGGRVLVLSQAALKLHKLRGAVLADLLDHGTLGKKETSSSVHSCTSCGRKVDAV